MMSDILEKMIFGNRVFDYLSCLGIFVVSVIALLIFRRIVLKRLKIWAEKTVTTLDDFIIGVFQKNLVPLLYFGAFYISIQNLNFIPGIKKTIDVLGVVILTIMAIRFLLELINYILLSWVKAEKNETRERSIKGVVSVIKIVIWGIGIVFLLDNLGFKVSTVIAGLGIGGVAVALAAQAILGDLFSFFSILFDRPFEVGDFIIVGDYLGAVEHVGIKTTRIRSLGGEQLIFSNTDLTNSRVRNYKRMEKRRVVFKLGVTYNTAYDKLKAIPQIIKNIIGSVKDTIFDRAHFCSYGDFNLVIEVVYYVIGADYNKYMDTQQEINLAIKQEFEKKGIEFAFPTQTLYVNKT